MLRHRGGNLPSCCRYIRTVAGTTHNSQHVASSGDLDRNEAVVDTMNACDKVTIAVADDDPDSIAHSCCGIIPEFMAIANILQLCHFPLRFLQTSGVDSALLQRPGKFTAPPR
ncbi:hypothetical protein Y032_0409g939 [Ancylostoma ceylanicum]|uniref:Uncharacterized protein n=1 Tax=Ancylostoma ceylanicum TaxID=53326 RepID=A0A016X2F8_9BILA|nr:hypothetical protein Y032_0409g939 [Ancylostoma ceylanicum]